MNEVDIALKTRENDYMMEILSLHNVKFILTDNVANQL